MKKKYLLALITIIILIVIFVTVSNTKHHTIEIINNSDTLSKDECELRANREYSDKIKLFGTPVIINGKQYDSLSKEQWEHIDNERQKAIEKC